MSESTVAIIEGPCDMCKKRVEEPGFFGCENLDCYKYFHLCEKCEEKCRGRFFCPPNYGCSK